MYTIWELSLGGGYEHETLDSWEEISKLCKKYNALVEYPAQYLYVIQNNINGKFYYDDGRIYPYM